MEALAIKDHISDGFPMIVHGRDDGYYKSVLKGERPSIHDALEDAGPAQDLEPCEDGILAISDGGVALDDGLGELADLTDNDNETDGSGVDDPIPFGDDDKVDECNVLVSELRGGTYGVFTLTPKLPRTAGRKGTRFGGYQATCPFHLLRPGSGCKRVFRFHGSTRADKLEAARVAAWWCLQHIKFVYQRDHLTCPIDPADVPPSEELIARKITERHKPADLLSDDMLDECDAMLALCPDVDAAPAVAPAEPALGPALARARGRGGRGKKKTPGRGMPADVDPPIDRGRGRGAARGSGSDGGRRGGGRGGRRGGGHAIVPAIAPGAPDPDDMSLLAFAAVAKAKAVPAPAVAGPDSDSASTGTSSSSD